MDSATTAPAAPSASADIVVESWRPQPSTGDDQHIVQLPEEVINKIAAGEVVQRPANATKELIENSLDAGATRIDVTATGGGMAVLRIEDNGHGIAHADYPLLCKRFATSKLKQFDDLLSIGTYGFRGEALASLSMVCRVEVTSRKRGTDATYVGKFRESEMKEAHLVPAGMVAPGTVVKATDMFYSMPQRREMMGKPVEEYRHIVDVLTRYSIQYPHCHFSCRKAVTAAPDLSAAPSQDRTAAIRQAYGKALADALLPVTLRHDTLDFSVSVLMSSLVHFNAKLDFTLFINGRLVNHDGLQKMVKTMYAALLPKKAQPYVFMELRLNPNNVDVNAHPTKEKVIFLGEDEIIEEIEREMRPVLERSLQESGNLHLKRKLSEVEGSFGTATASKRTAWSRNSSGGGLKREGSDAKEYEHNLVRTDHALGQGALDRYFTKTRDAETGDALRRMETLNVDGKGGAQQHHMREGAGAGGGEGGGGGRGGASRRERVPWARDPLRLTSVEMLLEETWATHDADLRRALTRAVYVGWVNQRHSLLQMELDLYLVDMCVLSAELFYQRALQGVGSSPPLPRVVLGASGLSVRELLSLVRIPVPSGKAAAGDGGGVDAPLPDAVLAYCEACLAHRAGLLAAYFGVVVEVGAPPSPRLTALPALVRGYSPPLRKLPLFLYRVAAAVDWDDEVACLRGVAAEMADLYMLDDGVVLPEAAAAAAAGKPTAAEAQAEQTILGDDGMPPSPPHAHTHDGGDGAGCCCSHPVEPAAVAPTPPPPALSSAPAARKPVLAVPDAPGSDSDDDAEGGEGRNAVPQQFQRVVAAQRGGAPPPPQHAAVPDLDSESEDDGEGEGEGESSPTATRVAADAQDPAWLAQHCILPAIKTSLLPPSHWRRCRALRKVADLPTMYKIFERC